MMRKVAVDKRGTEGMPAQRPGWRKRRRDATSPFFDPRDLSQVRPLIESIAPASVTNLRDRAILAVFVCAQASPGEVIGIKVKDYFTREDQQCLRLTENGRERIQIVDRMLKEEIDAYINAAKLNGETEERLFRAVDNRKPPHLIGRAINLGVIEKALMRHLSSRAYQFGLDQKLIDSIARNSLAASRDRAVIAIMLYTSASPEMIARMRMRDYYMLDGRWYIKLHGRVTCLAHPKLVEIVGDYLAATQLPTSGLAPLFGNRHRRAMQTDEIVRMIERRRASAARVQHLSANRRPTTA